MLLFTTYRTFFGILFMHELTYTVAIVIGINKDNSGGAKYAGVETLSSTGGGRQAKLTSVGFTTF